MKLRIVGWTALFSALVFATPAAAQGLPPIAFEARGGVSLPTGDFARPLTLGYGLGGHASVAVMPTLAIYGGYTYTSFDFDRNAPGEREGSYDLQGFDAGARFNAPTLTRISPYLRLGGVYYKGESSDGEISDKQKFGFQLGAGLEYELGRYASITPELRYTTISHSNRTDASYVTLDFGLRFQP